MSQSRLLQLAAIGLLAAGMVGGTASAQQGGFPPARVEVASAVMRDMAPTVEVPGTVVSLNDSRIASEVEGVLTWLADVGDPVDKGDVVARIDPALIRIERTRAEANLARLKSDHAYRQRQLERSEELAENNSISETLLDEARAQRDQALHALNDAEAALQRAQTNLARTEIRAAFAGHVTARLASLGEYVSIGEDVLRLVDTHRVEVALPAPISLASFLSEGMSVPVRNGDALREHVVRTVVPVGDDVSRMVEVRLSLDDSEWLVGTPVQVRLPSDRPVSTVAVPRDALVQRSGSSFVYKLGDDNTAQQVRVDINTTVDLWVGIRSGIEAGDRVVIRGAERLSPGQQVEVIEALGANQP